MELIVQPEDGLTPLVQAIRHAKTSIDIVIFRFDRPELEKAIEAAVARGVVVRALVAHTNRGGEKLLRKLETRMLAVGVTVARTADDLLRYHAKMMIVDDTLYVLGFNYTKLDVEKSRSFGVVTRHPRLVKEAAALFDADSTRQPYRPGHARFVVSPENARPALKEFIEGAEKRLLVYDMKVSDPAMLRLLRARARDGVDVRVLGKVTRNVPLECRKLPGLRLHVRAIVRDGSAAFVGSQSLRKIELDGRREVGVIVNDPAIAGRLAEVFEGDWRSAAPVDADGKDSERAEGEAGVTAKT